MIMSVVRIQPAHGSLMIVVALVSLDALGVHIFTFGFVTKTANI